MAAHGGVVLSFSRLRTPIFEQEYPTFSTNSEIEVTVTVEIVDGDLHAGAGPGSVVNDVARPFGFAALGLDEFVPVDAEGFALAGVFAVVSHEALAGDEL